MDNKYKQLQEHIINKFNAFAIQNHLFYVIFTGIQNL